MTIEIKGGVDIPDGTYKAQLESSEVRTDGKFGDGSFRVWNWLVETAEGIVPFSDSTSNGTGPKTKAYERIVAILGREPKIGDKIEEADLLLKTVVLTIGHKENGFPKVAGVGPYVEPQQTLPGTPR